MTPTSRYTPLAEIANTRNPCARIIRGIAHNPGRFITDAEVLQELMHHYLRTGRWIAGRQIFLRFETLLQGRIEPT